MSSKSILVVDDEVKILEVLTSYLEKEGYNVFTAENGKTALEIFESQELSLVLLDLMLPDISGEEICATIRRTSALPVIMLTAKVEEEDLLKGLNIGADDYITKPFSLRTLGARINAVLRRASDGSEPLFAQISFNNGRLVVDFTSHTVIKDGSELTLTPNEFAILSTFASYPSKVFTREELISTSFGFDYDGYDRTIDSHIKNLRRKLEDDAKKPVYIKTVHGVGYRFGGD